MVLLVREMNHRGEVGIAPAKLAPAVGIPAKNLGPKLADLESRGLVHHGNPVLISNYARSAFGLRPFIKDGYYLSDPREPQNSLDEITPDGINKEGLPETGLPSFAMGVASQPPKASAPSMESQRNAESIQTTTLPGARKSGTPGQQHNASPDNGTEMPKDAVVEYESAGSASAASRNVGSTNMIWEAYSEGMNRIHGYLPPRNAKVNSQLKQIEKRLGIEESVNVIQYYFSRSDQRFLMARHDPGLLLMNLHGIHGDMINKGRVNPTLARTAEKFADNRSAAEEAKRL
jgi:hypothetical protein